MRLDPTAAEAHSNLGLILLEQGEPEEALVHCREAVRLRPNFLAAASISATSSRCSVGSTRPRHVSARRSGSARTAAAHAGLAGVLEELGDSEGSLASLREALRHDPRHAGALARLATRLRDKLSDGRPGRHRGPAGRARSAAGSALAAAVRPGPGARRPGRVRPGRRARRRRPTRCNWPTSERRGLAYDPTAHRMFVDRLIDGVHPRVLRAGARLGPGDGAAGLRRRHAAVGHHAGRADPGEPPAGLRRRRAATRPEDVRGTSRGDRPSRPPHECLRTPRPGGACDPGPPAPRRAEPIGTARPTGSWTRCPKTRSTWA